MIEIRFTHTNVEEFFIHFKVFRYLHETSYNFNQIFQRIISAQRESILAYVCRHIASFGAMTLYIKYKSFGTLIEILITKKGSAP